MLPSEASWIAIGALPAAMPGLGLEEVEGVADSSSVQVLRCKRDLGAGELVQMAPKWGFP